MPLTEQTKASEMLCRAMYVTASPLNLVENQYWSDFFKFLRPAYKLPSRHEVSNTYLDREYAKVSTNVSERIAAANTVALICDGWSNVRNESIINFIATTPLPVFYKSLPTGKISHTAEYISSELSSIIEEIGPQKVFGIVTDNAANMQKAWKILETTFPNIFCYGCAAHGLNLLFTDLKKLKTLSSLITEAVEIVKLIKLSHKLNALFMEKQASSREKVSLKLPVQTRWGSVVTCLRSLLVNRHALQMLAIDEEAQPFFIGQKQKLKSAILLEVFWDKVSGFLCLLEPIATNITMVEADKPNLSSVYKIFCDLKSHFETNIPQSPFTKHEEKEAIEYLQKRMDFCIRDIHKVATLLDPKLCQKPEDCPLTQEDQTDATELIFNIASKMADVDETVVLTELVNYRAKESIFQREFLWTAASTVTSAAWWKGLLHFIFIRSMIY